MSNLIERLRKWEDKCKRLPSLDFNLSKGQACCGELLTEAIDRIVELEAALHDVGCNPPSHLPDDEGVT